MLANLIDFPLAPGRRRRRLGVGLGGGACCRAGRDIIREQKHRLAWKAHISCDPPDPDPM